MISRYSAPNACLWEVEKSEV